MADEIFDVVDDRDQVIGQETRPAVHRLGLKHRAVHVLIFNSAGEVFLQKRSMQKDNFPGTWDSSASGHLDTGDDYDACALREVREELGFQCEPAPQRLFKVDACAETGQEFVWVYEHRCEGPFTLHPDEIEEGGWFAPATVHRWIKERPREFASGFVLIWRKLFDQGRIPDERN